MPPWEAMEPLVWRGAFSKNASPFRVHKRPSEKKDTLSLGLECCCYLLGFIDFWSVSQQYLL